MNTHKKYLAYAVGVLTLCMALSVSTLYAADTGPGGGTPGPNAPQGGDTGPGTPAQSGIHNPLGSVSDIPSLIQTIVDAVVQIGYYIVVIFIIYSGFLFVKARGNRTELEGAKKAFLYTVVGAAILLGAQILSSVISNTVSQLG